ncbi:hypothetical protein RB601_001899 [Gaeumannomyces tritici]
MKFHSLLINFFLAVSVAGVSLPRDASPASGDPVLINEGRPSGVMKKVDGFDMYITYPPGYHTRGQQPKAGILHLTDVLGLPLLENLLLADSFARAGYVVVAPDLFAGKPAPDDHDRPDLGFSVIEFLDAHPPNVTEPAVDAAARHLRGALGVARLGSAGYCFGGRYAFRYASAAKHAAGLGVDVVATAHPTRVTDEEIVGRVGPATVAAAENDPFLMPPKRRWEIETALLSTDAASSLALYSGVAHGFGVRVNMSDPEARFAKQAAFVQAVRWFNYWL